MSRRLKKLITTHEFNLNTVGQLTLGAGTRLAADSPTAQNSLQLAKNNGSFPTTANLYVKTRLVRPTSMKQCIGFEANVMTPLVNRVEVTTVMFRLSTDGVDHLFWDGAAWSPAAPGEWNTEADIAANINSFSMASQGIQVIINLATTNAAYTPAVYWVKVLWLSDIEYIEDFVVRSFKPMMEAGVEPIAEFIYQFRPTDDMSTVAIVTPTKYQYAGIDAVYNLTTDPNRITDLFGSWDQAKNTVTLTTPATAGDRIEVRFLYNPIVSVVTDQEYSQVARLPAINIESVDQENVRYVLGTDSVTNKATGEGWQLRQGTQIDIVMSIRTIADKELDAQRMAEALTSFFWNNTLLVARGLDEPFTMIVDQDVKQTSNPSAAGLHGARLAVRITNAVFYLLEATQVFSITKKATPPVVIGPPGNVNVG